MKKVIFFAAILAFMGLSSMNVNAQSGTTGPLSWNISDNILTISGSGDMPNYSESSSVPWFSYRNAITTIIIGDGVTSIGDWAFNDCGVLTSITIPNSVTSIGEATFSNCSSLISIAIPSGVTSIGDWAFYFCGDLTSITIPDSMASIGDNVFYLCFNLTSITIPNSVTSIGNSAFGYCSSLTSITIPNSVTNIGYNAFNNCSNLTTVNFNADSCVSMGWDVWNGCTSLTTVNIGDNVKAIPNNAFLNCSKLTSVTISKSVTSIGWRAFGNCSSLTSITIPNNVKTIESQAFNNCVNLATVNFNADSCISVGIGCWSSPTLTTVNIGDNVKIIPNFAFHYCSELTSIIIPNSVTTIGISAFSYCRSVTFIAIGNSVTHIGDDAFFGCRSTTSITVHATTPPALGTLAFSSMPDNTPVYIPCFSYNNYRTAFRWNKFTNFVVNGHVDSTFYTVTQCYGTTYTDDNFTTPINSSGVYYTTLSNNTNCDSVIILDITFTNLPVRQELCMVSVDENYHNEIVWKQTDTVISYNIYRDGESGTYDLIATIDYKNTNRWVDSASNAMTRSYCYRIAGIDTCGNESALSAIHKTMHLAINAGQNNSWNLSWTPYEGVSYSLYNIYRASHDAPNNMELVYTMPDGNTSYTDFSAPEGYVYYMIEIMIDNPCVLTKSLSSIKSNIASNNPSIGIADMKAQGKASLHIFPNSTTGQLRIERGEWAMESVEVFDMMGRKQYVELREGDGVVLLNISHLSAGMYLVKAGNMTGKVVKE